MSVRRLWALGAVPAFLSAVCGLLLLRPVEIRTSLDELIGASGKVVPAAIRERTSSLVPVIVSSREANVARAAADRFVAALASETDADFAVRYRHDGEEVSRIMEFCRIRRAGLAAPSVVEKLKTPEGRAAIARAAARRYYSSPVPPLFRPEDDPFGLLDGFVASLPTSFSGWFPKDGVLTAARDGVVHLLVMLELKPGAPTYFVACVWTGLAYRAVIRCLPGGVDEMAKGYADALKNVCARFANQWFEWRK